jgi:hypothetical protein
MADSRKLEPREWPEVRQVAAIEINVMQRAEREQRGDHHGSGNQGRTRQKHNDAARTARPP